MFSVNWKSRTTWTGITAIVAAAAGYATGEMELVPAIYAALGGLAVIFGRAAIKPVVAVALCFALTACSTLPATQNAKESAGRSRVTQHTETWQNDYRSFLPDVMKIDGDFNLTIYANGNDRPSDVTVTNSGSTTATQAATATQSPTSTTTTDAAANVSGLPGQ